MTKHAWFREVAAKFRILCRVERELSKLLRGSAFDWYTVRMHVEHLSNVNTLVESLMVKCFKRLANSGQVDKRAKVHGVDDDEPVLPVSLERDELHVERVLVNLVNVCVQELCNLLVGTQDETSVYVMVSEDVCRVYAHLPIF